VKKRRSKKRLKRLGQSAGVLAHAQLP